MPEAKVYSNNIPTTTKSNWTLILVFLVVLSIPLTLLALKLYYDYRFQASDAGTPVEVVVSNITDTSATISLFNNGAATNATIQYGQKGSDISTFQVSLFDERATADPDQKFNLHYHKLTGLSPQTEYEFKVKLGDKEFPNTDATFENIFKTLTTSSNVPVPRPINGKITGTNFADSVIYAHISDGSSNSLVVSSLVPESGAYSLDIGGARKPDGTSFSNGNIVVFASTQAEGRGYVSEALGADTQFMPDIKLAKDAQPYDPKSQSYAPGTAATPSATTTTTPTSTPTITTTPTVTNTPTPTSTSTPLPTPSPTPIITPPPSLLKLNNISTNSSILQGGTISGQSAPSDTVKISLDNISLGSTVADTQGSWKFALPNTAAAGNRKLKIETNSNQITIDIKIEKLNDLPTTAIDDYYPHMTALALLALGFSMYQISRKPKLEKIEIINVER